MCERFHRARERKNGHKNIASAPTHSISIGDFRWQTNTISHTGKPEFVSTRTIQVRPSRNPRWQKQDGWEVFEADHFLPLVWKQYAHTGARATDFQARANTPLS